MSETIKLLGRTKLTVEIVFVHCNILNYDYLKYLRVFYKLFPNKSPGQLRDIPPTNFIFLKTFNSEFSHFELWFTDQNPKPIETEDKIHMNLVIN